MYYYLTLEQYNLISSQISHTPAWTLDGTHCIVHNDNNIAITQYVTLYNDSNAVNDWRWNPDTEEWRRWITEDEYNGII